MSDTKQQDPNSIGEKKLSENDLIIIKKMKAGEIDGIAYQQPDPKGIPTTHVLKHQKDYFSFDEERNTLVAQNFVLEKLEAFF